MYKNDVDITVDVELLREEFYRIKKSTSLLPSSFKTIEFVTVHIQITSNSSKSSKLY